MFDPESELFLDRDEQLNGMDPSIMLSDNIDGRMYEKVLRWLGFWRYENPKKVLEAYIYIPDGGELAATFAIAEGFLQSPNPVRTIATGDCYSGGAFLVAAGTRGERYAYPSAEFMIHQIQVLSSDPQQSVPDMVESAEHYKKVNHKYLQFLSELTRQPVDKLESFTKKEMYLSAQEALELGIIYKIAPRYKNIREVLS